MCGVVGFFSLKQKFEAKNVIYDSLFVLQHRGQDAAGIVTFDGSFHTVKGLGFVREVFSDGKKLKTLTGSLGVGHTRYSTTGLGLDEDAQPFVAHYPYGIAMVHNGQVVNFQELRKNLRYNAKWHINSGCDVEIILGVFSDELAKQNVSVEDLSFEHIKKAVEGVYKKVRGAYSVVGIIARKGIFAFRDPLGIRPLVFGKQEVNSDTRYMFASESVACDISGFSSFENVEPGEVVYINYEDELHREIVAEKSQKTPCIFEYIYFARPDSIIEGISVYKTRLQLGELLAKAWLKEMREKNLEMPDVVIPVPDTSRPAAAMMASVLNKPYREGLIKNRYIARTFITPGENKDRRKMVRQKLNPIKTEFQDKIVMLVDDSIVRGNTVREIIKIAHDMGARKVYFAIHSAPLKSPCFYGIDMSTKGEFIASKFKLDIDKICADIGADHLFYMKIDDMIKAAKHSNPNIENFCTACFSADYPTHDIDEKVHTEFQLDREKATCAYKKSLE
ncbi:MAG: amidophosphoribosyltransferase [Planctomycetes bacterium]|nr:amidophosphoribosyltransferase [Planctomycetota bacterium]